MNAEKGGVTGSPRVLLAMQGSVVLALEGSRGLEHSGRKVHLGVQAQEYRGHGQCLHRALGHPLGLGQSAPAGPGSWMSPRAWQGHETSYQEGPLNKRSGEVVWPSDALQIGVAGLAHPVSKMLLKGTFQFRARGL